MKRKLLFAAALLVGVLGFETNAQEPPVKPVPVTTTLADDGNTIQYLYNVDAGAFFLGANNWSTRASVSATRGYKFKVAKNNDGITWTLNDLVEEGDDKIKNKWLAVFAGAADDIWVDNLGGANVDKWVITPADGNTFKISNPSAAQGNLAVVPSKNDTRLYLSTEEDAQDVWAAVLEQDYTKYLAEYKTYLEALDKYNKSTYKVGDDIVDLAPTTWDGQTGTYASLYSERFQKSSIGVGDVLTQTITGLKNGVYTVTLKLAASCTNGRDNCKCPIGDDHSVGFAQDKTQNITVVDKGGDGLQDEEYTNAVFTVNVLDGTLKYGIKNIAPSGNWYVASVTSIIYKYEAINVDGLIYAVKSENLIENGSFENGFTGWTASSDFKTELSPNNYELKTEGAQDGEKYLFGKITSTDSKVNGASGTASLGTAWQIAADKTYLFSYYVKSEGTIGKDGTNYLKTTLTNAPAGNDTNFYPLGTPEVTPNGEWCQFQKIFTNDTPYSYIQISFRWLDRQWGFDNFTLYEIELLSTELDIAKIAANKELDALTPVGDGLFKYSQTDIDAARAAIEAAESVEAVKAVTMPTKALPVADKAYAIGNASANGSLAVTGTDVMVVPNGIVYFTSVDGGYVLSNAEGEYIFKTSGNNWTLSTTKDLAQAYVLTVNVVDGGYTLQGSKGLLGTDNGNAGSAVYANKGVANNGVWSSITAAEVTYAVKVTDAGYATWVAPADVSFAGTEVYIVEDVTEGDDVVAQLTTVDNATKGTAVIIKAEEAEEDENKVYGYAFPIAESANSYENNKLKVSEGGEKGDGIYVLAKLGEEGEEVVGFYALAENYSLPAGKVYLDYTANSNVKFIGFGNGNATDIKGVENTATAAENAVIYNIAGQRVSNPTKGGIYIINGKKVLVK